MPIAKVQMPDGKIGRFEVPEGTTPEQVIEFAKNMQLDEHNTAGRFLSGIGGKVLDAASGVAEMLPGVSEHNPISNAAQEGLNNATGTAGEVGKLVGGAVPYMALPESLVPSALTAAGIGAATSHGNIEERAKEGAVTGATTGIAGMIPVAATAVGRGLGHIIGGAGTHTGGETIIDAARSGYEGGDKLKALLDFMRNKAPLSEIVKTAEKGQAGLAKNDSEAYTAARNVLIQDKTVLPYQPIEDALKSAGDIGTYEGHVVNPAAVNVHEKLQPIINEWSGRPYPQGKPSLDMNTGQMVQPMHEAFPPEQAHTIEGLDQLKKRLGVEYKSTPQGTPERLVIKNVYNSVKGAIEDQNNAYKGLMEKTKNAIERRKELAQELSLKETLTDSTALRKLLAVPRNNANTNYGNRVELAKLLEDNGSKNLMTMLNGAALNSYMSRGLGGAIGESGTAGAAIYSLMSGHPLAATGLAGLTLMQSPRIMGEAAVKVGQTAKVLKGPYKNLVTPALISAIENRNKQ